MSIEAVIGARLEGGSLEDNRGMTYIKWEVTYNINESYEPSLLTKYATLMRWSLTYRLKSKWYPIRELMDNGPALMSICQM